MVLKKENRLYMFDPNNVNWFSYCMSEKPIEFWNKYADYIDWEAFSANQLNIPEFFWLKYVDRIHWYSFCLYQKNISEKFWEECAKYLDWNIVSYFHSHSLEFWLKFRHKLIPINIKYNRHISNGDKGILLG